MLCLCAAQLNIQPAITGREDSCLLCFREQLCTGKSYVIFFVFFLPYLQVQDNGLLSSRNYITMATWPNYFFSL